MKRLLPLAVLLLLAACASPPARQAAEPAPALAARAALDEWYRAAAAAGRPVYAVDVAQSLVAITVRRSGALARLGHDHVVASRTLSGFAAPDDGRADLRFTLADMSVDEATLRAEAGLDTQPSAEAIEGTRINMLNRVLEVERFPEVLLRAEPLAGGMLRLTITLHGVTRAYEVPTQLERDDAALVASGTLQLRQTDFGIAPMSLLGGAIAVRDDIELRFRIAARRIGR